MRREELVLAAVQRHGRRVLFGLIWALVAAFAQLATFVLVTWSGSS